MAHLALELQALEVGNQLLLDEDEDGLPMVFSLPSGASCPDSAPDWDELDNLQLHVSRADGPAKYALVDTTEYPSLQTLFQTGSAAGMADKIRGIYARLEKIEEEWLTAPDSE